MSMDVVKFGPTQYRVTSETAWDRTYTVDLSVPNCTCTAWATGRNKRMAALKATGLSESAARDKTTFECKHITEAKRHVNDEIDNGDPTTAAARKAKEAVQAKFKKGKVGQQLRNLIGDLEESE